MGNPGIIKKIKMFIAAISWKLFLWASDCTAEEYHDVYMDAYLKGELRRLKVCSLMVEYTIRKTRKGWEVQNAKPKEQNTSP